MMSIIHPLGIALNCCPWALLRSEDVQEVSALHSWKKDGCLNPDTLDLATRRAVEAFGRGLADHEHEVYERMRKDAEAKKK